MLTSIDVDSENSFSLPILGVTPKDSILVRKVSGLNPAKPDLFIGDYARDGGYYGGRRVGVRNVVVTADLNPNPALGETMQSLREDLYKAFLDPQVESDFIKLGLNIDDGRKLYLYGYTENFETDMFDVESMVQISIICPDPYLRDDVPTSLNQVTGWISTPFTYGGTAETGFEVSISINASTEVLTLQNNGKKMVFNRSFVPGQTVKINTIPGVRSAVVQVGNGPAESIYGDMTVDSPWLELHSQNNTMKVYGATTDNLVAAIHNITYRAAYWGI